jgi:hypothetical protein
MLIKKEVIFNHLKNKNFCFHFDKLSKTVLKDENQ